MKGFVYWRLSSWYVLVILIKGRDGFFIKHSGTGLCIKPTETHFDSGPWGQHYYVKFYDDCLHSDAQFRYVDKEFVVNIGKDGTLIARFGPRYLDRFLVYHPGNQDTKKFLRKLDHTLKQTASGSLITYQGTHCAIPRSKTTPVKGGELIRTTTCDTELQKFTFGSVTKKDAIMTDVSCASSQKMVVVMGEYGVFSNGKTFDKRNDTNCSLPVGCILKGLCDNKTSCDITVDSRFTFNQCSGTKRLHMEYRCVDSLGTPITSVSDVRLSSDGAKPSEGFIEVRDGVWKMVNDDDWNEKKQAELCRHLGYIDGYSFVRTNNIGSETKIASGYLYCVGAGSSNAACCAYLYTSTFAANSKISYARCKVCDYPLLERSATFPDSAFTSSDANVNAYDGRLTNAGWCPTSTGSQWLQIDLQKDYYISHIATFGDKDQTKWVTSYLLQYSRTASGLGKSSARQRMIKANEDAYRVSITTLTIVSTRYLKMIISPGNSFCIRVELCGYELPGSKLTVTTVGPRTLEINLKISIAGLPSGAISYYLISLKAQRGVQQDIRNLTRDEFVRTRYYRLQNLKPYTNYTLDVTPGNAYGVGGSWTHNLHTKEAAPETPPSNVKVVVHNMTSVIVSWDALPKEKWNGKSITYIIYQNESVGSSRKFEKLTTTSRLVRNLKTATEYSFRVSASTSKESDPTDYITKITNQVAVEGHPEKYNSIKINLTKQHTKFNFRTAYVIVQSSKSSVNDPDTYETKDLYSSSSSSPYITARLSGDDLLIPFEVGAGNFYNDMNPPVHNKPLEGNSKYRIFVRYFGSNKIYFSTEWSKEILTFSRPTAPTEVKAKFLEDGSLEISWKIPALGSQAKLMEYNICYKQECKTETCVTAKTSPHKMENKDLDPKAKYEIRVRTQTSVGNSEYAVKIINDWASMTCQVRECDEGCSKTVLYVVIISVSLVLNAVFVVVVTCLCFRLSKLPPSSKDMVLASIEDKSNNDGIYDEVQNPDALNANIENTNSSAYEALDLSKRDQDPNTYQSLIKPTV